MRVETGGQIVFEKVAIRALKEYGGRTFVYVEGTESAAPMSDVTLLEKAPLPLDLPQPLPLTRSSVEQAESGEEMDRFTVDEGVVKITFPADMTADSVDELADFLQLFIKKAKLLAGAGKNPS